MSGFGETPSLRRAEIARNKAQVAQMQAALESAEEDMGNSTIVNPMEVLVLSRNVEVGAEATPISSRPADVTDGVGIPVTLRETKRAHGHHR